jgi:NaMN:DMB phosphoribosyltransferase
MVVVLVLVLELTPAAQRPRLAAQVAIATTAWVAQEGSSNLPLLLERLAVRWGIEPLAFAASLRFSQCSAPELQAFEQGYVKEGVGAGGLALLWQLSGRDPADLAAACDQACPLLR